MIVESHVGMTGAHMCSDETPFHDNGEPTTQSFTFIDGAQGSGPASRARAHPSGARVSDLTDVGRARGAACQNTAFLLQLEWASNGGSKEAKASIRRSHVSHTKIQTYVIQEGEDATHVLMTDFSD